MEMNREKWPNSQQLEIKQIKPKLEWLVEQRGTKHLFQTVLLFAV